jgi:hypothetical protein
VKRNQGTDFIASGNRQPSDCSVIAVGAENWITVISTNLMPGQPVRLSLALYVIVAMEPLHASFFHLGVSPAAVDLSSTSSSMKRRGRKKNRGKRTVVCWTQWTVGEVATWSNE